MNHRFVLDWDAYARIARGAAADGAVLLKNEQSALPLQNGSCVAVFGRIQLHYYRSGSGSGGLVNTRYTVGILDALKEEKALSVDSVLEQTYREWVSEHPFDEGRGWGREPWHQAEMPLRAETVMRAAAENDAAVVIIGRTSGEDRDAAPEAGSWYLTMEEEDMLRQVCAAFSRTVVVLNIGNIMDMSWVEKYQPQAVLIAWQGGMEGGHAVADLLTGRVNPSGKLTDTIARRIEDYPSTANFGGVCENIYQEDIYVGYRWFETFSKDRVLYPFGYGLSYTRFSVTCSELTRNKGHLFLNAVVENIGSCDGREVVQLYGSAPQGRLGKPARVLLAYQKTELLQPGESVSLCFDIPESLLASYDDSGKSGHPYCWVLEEGEYTILFGTDVRSAQPVGAFRLNETQVISEASQALAPVRLFERFRAAETTPGALTAQKEFAPLRAYDLQQRMLTDTPESFPFAGDQGLLLKDVLDGRCSMEAFLSQLTDDDLCCLVRGEGMGSSKVTPGTGAAFGGVTDRLKAFGIPCGCCSDGPSGIRMDCGTYAFSLPNGTCLACTFDDALVEKLFTFLGCELRKNRIDCLLGPGMNIHRNPLNGRNFEYFSEDPIVAGKMAAAQLRGLHQYDVTGVIKHFAANNQEANRRVLNSIVSERALREIYLKGFEIAVKEGQARAIMTTYGAVNGIWTGSSYDLATHILRNEWHYDGLVMTDWWAMLNDEHGEPSPKNTAAMIRAQNDLYMVVDDALSNSGGDNLASSLQEGTLSRGQLLRCADNILRMLLKTPAMLRITGCQPAEELEAEKLLDKEDQVDFHIPYYTMTDFADIPVETVSTGKGSVWQCGIRIADNGFYQLRMRLKVDADVLAQVPMSIFANGRLMESYTFHGTSDEQELIADLGLFAGTNQFLKLFFAQSGITLTQLRVELREKLTKPFWEM